MNGYTLPHLLDLLWKDYLDINPSAQYIFNLFIAKGEKIINDHIAFRTYNHPSINIDTLAQVFTPLGYTEKGEYDFKKKKLYAKHFEHANAEMPLIFISELQIEEFGSDTQEIIKELIDQIPENFTSHLSFIFSGRPWNLSYSQYLSLKKVSEYAAWIAAFGFRVNHFTISLKNLNNFHGIEDVNQFLKNHGIQLNDAGGEVKGTRDDYLEQSSTVAYNKETTFSDGNHVIPACYYEFAMRHKKPDGNLFRGFIAGSADKIFESTDKGQDFST